MVDQIADGLIRRGCKPGTPCAILSPNDPRAFACMLGILEAGAAWVPINVRNDSATNAAFLAAVKCEWLFWHGALADSRAVFTAVVDTLRHDIRIDAAADGPGSLVELCGMHIGDVERTNVDRDRICTIVGTGGTTGAPRAVTWTENTWDALIATASVELAGTRPPVHLCVAPMTHAAGVLSMMLMPQGPTNVVLDRTDPIEIMQTIEQQGVTHVYLPPTLLYLMLAHPDVRSFNYSSLSHFIVTSAPVAPEKLREAIDVFGPVMAQMYGQSEAPMILSYFPPEAIAEAARGEGDDRLQSCGRPTILTDLRIMDASGSLLERGAVGEIVVRGPLVMNGYLGDAEATAEASRYGWHHTGDVGFIDDDGFVHLVDRQRDVIITGGFNVYPVEVERLILSHPAVQECAVIGVPDGKWGEAVKAVIELKPGQGATSDELIAFCRERLGGVKTPKTVDFRDELPRSAVGKVLKRDIRAPFWVGLSRNI